MNSFLMYHTSLSITMHLHYNTALDQKGEVVVPPVILPPRILSPVSDE